jgi:hypothetical protein
VSISKRDGYRRPDPAAICFGLSPEHDQQSLAAYLQLLGHPELANTLAARLSSEEIEKLIDHLGSLMRQHLSKTEYHHLFLAQGVDRIPTDCS